MLNEQQTKAAWLKAHGRTDVAIIAAIGCHKSTYYRWAAREDFQAAVRGVEEKIASENPLTAEEAEGDLINARATDRAMLAIQKELIDELSGFSLEVIKHVRQDGAENFSPRSLPALCKTLFEAITAMQATTDRLIGIEALISDVEEIETALQQAEQQREGEPA